MSSKFVPLEEAATLLGVATDKLVAMRSSGDIRGFKDGASWKFPQAEIDRLLADGLGDEPDEYSGFGYTEDEDGSAILSTEQGAGSGSRIIGGDQAGGADEDSDLQIGGEPLSEGSDVALVAGDGRGSDSDLQLVPAAGVSSGDTDRSDDDDDQVDLSIDLSLSGESPSDDGDLQIGGEPLAEGSDLSLAPAPPRSKSGDGRLQSSAGLSTGDTNPGDSIDGDDVDLSIDLSLTGDSPSEGDELNLNLADDAASDPSEINLAMTEPSTGGSDLELAVDDGKLDLAGDSAIMPPKISLGDDDDDDLGLMDDSDEDIDLSDLPKQTTSRRSGNDVLSELDLLSADQGGSGSLIRGDSEESLLDGSGLNSPLSDLSDIDDALNDDDDLVISDDDDDLVLGDEGSGSGIMDDSGINLMSPSDSGLSLESEPLDLAGSSISALDLGGDASGATPGSSPGSAVSGGSSGSLVDFKADEEFQLSPSGIGLEVDDDSASQVIEVEHSDAFGVAVMDDDAFVDPTQGDGRGWAQRNELLADDAEGIDDASLVAEGVDEPIVERVPKPQTVTLPPGAEVPFSVWNVAALAGILIMLSIGGMLATDLIGNLWQYSEPTSPISSLGETILSALGMNG